MLLEGPLPHRRNLGVVDLNLISGECSARSGQQHDQACCHCLHGEVFTFRELASMMNMSALPPKADIAERDWHVRFVPKADIGWLTRLARQLGRAAKPEWSGSVP